MKLSRRRFTSMSAVALAGISTEASFSYNLLASARNIGPNDKINVGLIGCKNMGWGDLQDFLRIPEVECIALCDVDSKSLNQRATDVEKIRGKKPQLFKDYRKLLDLKDLNVVIVGTPDHWHCLITVDAIKAGKDVYVEKPLANSIAECNIMASAAKNYNRIVQVGQQQRSGGEWQDAISVVKSGKLGKVSRIKCWANFNYGAVRPGTITTVPDGVDFDFWLGPAPERSFDNARFHGSWRMFWDYGGGLMTDWGVHLLDMGLWAKEVSSFPKKVIACGGKYSFPEYANETPDTLSVTFEYNDWVLEWEHNAGIESGPWGRNYGIAFIGTNGTLVADRSKWEVYPEGSKDKLRMEIIPARKSDNNMHLLHVQNFVDCLKSGQTPACSIETGRMAAIVAHLGNVALRTGTILEYNPVNQDFGNNKAANQLLLPVYRKPWVFPEL
jgi:predicted dehydrogenase